MKVNLDELTARIEQWFLYLTVGGVDYPTIQPTAEQLEKLLDKNTTMDEGKAILGSLICGDNRPDLGAMNQTMFSAIIASFFAYGRSRGTMTAAAVAKEVQRLTTLEISKIEN